MPVQPLKKRYRIKTSCMNNAEVMMMSYMFDKPWPMVFTTADIPSLLKESLHWDGTLLGLILADYAQRAQHVDVVVHKDNESLYAAGRK